MTERWQSLYLGDIAVLRRDRVDPRRLPADEVMTHWSIPALDETGAPARELASSIGSHKFVVETDSVLISLLNPRIPRFALAKGSASTICSTEFAVLTPKESMTNVDFLRVLVSSASFAKSLASLVSGTTKSRERVKANDLLGLPIRLPPIDVQQRVVDLIGAADHAIEAGKALADCAESASRDLVALLMSGRRIVISPDGPITSVDVVPAIALGDVVSLDIDAVPVEPGRTYPIAGVLNAGQGLLERPAIDGSDTNYPTLQRIGADQLIMRRLTAWEGPITVVPASFDGYFVSQEFPTFTIDARRLLRGYLRVLCRSPALWAAMKDSSTGTVQRRKRVSAARLLQITIPVPPVDEQMSLTDLAKALEDIVSRADEEVDRLRSMRSALLSELLSGTREIPASYDRLVGG